MVSFAKFRIRFELLYPRSARVLAGIYCNHSLSPFAATA
jgi:hypothetical protein